MPDEDHLPSVEDRVRVTDDVPEYPGPQYQVFGELVDSIAPAEKG